LKGTVTMKKLLLGAFCAAAALTAVSSANAAGGCGLRDHRGPYGGCRVNANGALIQTTPVGNVRVGSFYPHRGYWDGRRYWGHRYAWRGGWRYR
jgi:hypothetical protein